MSDLTQRLREGVDPANIAGTEKAMDAAADEIERLGRLLHRRPTPDRSGFVLVADPSVPIGELHVRDAQGRLLARVTNVGIG